MRFFLTVLSFCCLAFAAWSGQTTFSGNDSGPLYKNTKERALLDVRIDLAVNSLPQFLAISANPQFTFVIDPAGAIERYAPPVIFPLHEFPLMADGIGEVSHTCLLEEFDESQESCPIQYSRLYIAWYNTFLYSYFYANPRETDKYRGDSAYPLPEIDVKTLLNLDHDPDVSDNVGTFHPDIGYFGRVNRGKAGNGDVPVYSHPEESQKYYRSDTAVSGRLPADRILIVPDIRWELNPNMTRPDRMHRNKTGKDAAIADARSNSAAGEFRFFVYETVGHPPIAPIVRADGSIDNGQLFWELLPPDMYVALYDPENDIPFQCVLEQAGHEDPDCRNYYDKEYMAWYNTWLYNFFGRNPEMLERFRSKEHSSDDGFRPFAGAVEETVLHIGENGD